MKPKRFEVIVKSFKKNVGVDGIGRSGGCEPRIEVIVESKKKSEGGMPGEWGLDGCDPR